MRRAARQAETPNDILLRDAVGWRVIKGKKRELSEERRLSRDLETDLDATKDREDALLAEVAALKSSRDRFRNASERESAFADQLRTSVGDLQTKLRNVGANLTSVKGELAQKTSFLSNSWGREKLLKADLGQAHKGVSDLVVLTWFAGISSTIFVIYFLILFFGPFYVVAKPW